MQRRDFIKTAFWAGTLASGVGGCALSNSAMGSAAAESPLRVLHLTDIHIRPEENAPERCAKLLKDIRRQEKKIDFVLNAGDSILAADYGDITRERMLELWKIWDDVVMKGLSGLEVYSCLGNHDMWWAAPSKEDPMRGKDYACKRVGMPKRYYTVDKGNWRIIVLDGNNRGLLDDEQRQWLRERVEELDAEQPVLLMSHQPLLDYQKLFNGMGDWQKQMVEWFSKMPRRVHYVSGHTHEFNELRFRNLGFYSNGALSGFWWAAGPEKDGSVKGTPMGYALLDLYPDGRIQYTFHDATDRPATP